jgi:hypothetical protein
MDGAAAELRCVPPAADLGEVRGGPARKCGFELINDGKQLIEIVEVERGCGCLEPKLDRRILQPGERATLLLELRTGGQPNGPRSWNLRVRYRDGGVVREELLVLSAVIRNEVTVQPPMLALCVQEMLRQEIVVSDVRAAPLKVTAVQASSPALRASIQAQAGGVAKIAIEVAAAALGEGRQEAVLSIYTDDPLYSPLQLPITLTRGTRPALTVTPPTVQLPIAADNPVATALVRLRPADGHKVVIESVEADDPGVTCTWAAGPGAGATLKVQVDRRRLDNHDTTRTLRVRLVEPPHEVTIPVIIER